MIITKNQLASIFLLTAGAIWLGLEIQWDHFSPLFNLADVHHETWILVFVFVAIVVFVFAKKKVKI